MDLSRRAVRRLFGAGVLLLALGMLILGQSVLQDRLQGMAFVSYWLCCFALTVLAMLVALFDVRRVRVRTHQEERELLQDTLRDIQSEAKAKSRRQKRSPGAGSKPG